MAEPSPLLDFLNGTAPDAQGRFLADILDWDDRRLEHVHDYIQWLFPLPEASAFNPDAPLLTPADIEAFADPALQRVLLASFRRMLRFYGFVLDTSETRVAPGPNFAERAAEWLTSGNHNLLRITRILRSLTLLGLGGHARAFLAALEALEEGRAAIGAVTLGYWRRAVEPG